MRIVVDFDLCESNAVCMQIAPDIFEVRDDDFLYILNDTPSESDRARVEECEQRCPKQAISIACSAGPHLEGRRWGRSRLASRRPRALAAPRPDAAETRQLSKTGRL